MDSLSILIVFVFGTLVGSFLNVVSIRYNTGLSITRGRSKCMTCSAKLKWYELIPIAGFMALQGKCRTCKSSISRQYPAVEFITGIAFALIAWRQASLWHIYGAFEDGLLYSIIFAIFYSLIFSVLILIGIYDFRHKIIPDRLVYAFVILSFAKLVLFFFICRDFVLSKTDFFDLLSPFILFIFFASLWYYSKGKWMGFGDAKLALGIGAFLGFTYGLSAIVLAFWSGAIWGVLLIILRRVDLILRKINLSSEIPFAPFLIIATAVVFFWQIDILGLENMLG